MKNLKDTKKAEAVRDRWLIASQQAGVYSYLEGVVSRAKVEYRTILNNYRPGYSFTKKW